MNMKTNYSIRNFRVFDKDGATIQLKPISLLVLLLFAILPIGRSEARKVPAGSVFVTQVV